MIFEKLLQGQPEGIFGIGYNDPSTVGIICTIILLVLVMNSSKPREDISLWLSSLVMSLKLSMSSFFSLLAFSSSVSGIGGASSAKKEPPV